MTARTLRVIAFPGAPNLPTFAAIANGCFADEGLELDLKLTPSSVEQARATAAGDCDIACTAFDNVVAYAEGQGAAGPDVDPGYVVVAGATQLELSLVVTPGIETFADLRGRSVALDALATGFAFVLYDMMARNGIGMSEVEMAAVGATPQRWQSVKAGTHAATLTIEPFTSIAVKSGFRVLARSSDIYDSYQGGVIAARRGFAARHPDAVQGFLRAYLRGLAWVRDPANRDAAEALLQERMPEVQPQAVRPVMESLLSPRSGLTPGAAVLPEGMANVLGLRTRFGAGGAVLSDAGKYLDLSHLEALGAAR
ncbi:ABC transporter substrate-binding protein [Halovulum dunhuangense]|uniref:ABC transporter substrate-binding protein n=1 Tax=Halovulum dunhuangense TaxID=1505036 RepID=A0A849L371_9RHOB|nr:ABC transporter substrate-binding protein [Halovulum dunhuangense]NNU80786.1 ABC transporter substrate-binding protein [Halovulum dunhuangense]